MSEWGVVRLNKNIMIDLAHDANRDRESAPNV